VLPIHSQPELWSRDATQSLDPALAHLGAFVAQMRFERVFDGSLRGCLQRIQILDGLRGENDL
jgi:hypothetical protein